MATIAPMSPDEFRAALAACGFKGNVHPGDLGYAKFAETFGGTRERCMRYGKTGKGRHTAVPLEVAAILRVMVAHGLTPETLPDFLQPKR